MPNRHSSFASLAAITAAVAAHATPPPANTVVASATLSNLNLYQSGNTTFDINCDGTYDFQITWNAYWDSLAFMGLNSARITANAVGLGSFIDGSANTAPSRYLTTQPNGVLYYGLQATTTSGTIYGWFTLDYTTADSDTDGKLSAYFGTTPDTGVIVSAAAVPEPSAGLAATGLAGTAALILRKRRKSKA